MVAEARPASRHAGRRTSVYATWMEAGHVHHGHAHGAHGHHGHSHVDRDASRRALGLSLAFTVALGAVQVVGGVALGSLALLADAAHNVSDGAAIGLALAAAWLAGLPARGARTFGWKRAEVLAALVNALALIVVGALILWEAVQRIDDPPDVEGLGVIVLGAVGLVANGVPVWLMATRADRDNLNVRAALAHAAVDLAGSAAVVLAGVVILTTGFREADPILAAAVGVLVLGSAWGVLREALGILLESAPAGVDPERLGTTLAAVPGVVNVHDLHVWTITSGFPAVSAHVVVAPAADRDDVLHALQRVAADAYGIRHVTFQVDRDHAELLQIHHRGCPEAARRTTPVEPG